MPETLEATETLTKEGFQVMVYCSDDPIMCKRLEDVGAVAIMPLGAPIGSGLGIQNPVNIRLIIESAGVPVIVDAGVGTASDAAAAMELGCDVISEKPLTIDAASCQRILDTQRKTGMRCRVAFNYRYSSPRTQVKELLASGVIGEVHSVDFHWLLDTRHGADYFRRWHRNKANSGGLLVHKATHHFDLVNWWLDSVPEHVFASGHRRYYTGEQADALVAGGIDAIIIDGEGRMHFSDELLRMTELDPG